MNLSKINIEKEILEIPYKEFFILYAEAIAIFKLFDKYDFTKQMRIFTYGDAGTSHYSVQGILKEIDNKLTDYIVANFIEIYSFL